MAEPSLSAVDAFQSETLFTSSSAISPSNLVFQATFNLPPSMLNRESKAPQLLRLGKDFAWIQAKDVTDPPSALIRFDL